LNKTGGLNTFQAQWLKTDRPEIEFYDLKTDPRDLNNLAAHPDHAPNITQMRSQLDSWIQSSGDRGAAGDPTTEPPMEQIQKEKRADYQRTWTKRLGKPEPTDAERLAWWMRLYRLE
jgi:hypothetical protein